MIKQEMREVNGKEFRYTYSDENFKIKQVQDKAIYSSAYDVLESENTYTETNELNEEIVEKENEEVL